MWGKIMLTRFFFLFLAGILLFGGRATAQETTQSTNMEYASKIVCDEPNYNFGEMENTRTVEHTFIIQNNGNLSLEISKVRPGCGCTVANISTKTLPPGESAEISTRLNLRGRQGRQRKPITVYSNDPKTPQLKLYLEGTAVTEVNVNPRSIFFGRIAEDAVVTSTVEVVIKSKKPVHLTKVESRSENLTVSEQIADEGRLYKILIATKPPLKQGTLRSSVHIETDHPQYPAMDIVVSAFVVGDLTFVPQQIDVQAKPDQTITRYVLIRSEGNRPFEITSVEAPLSTIETKVQQTAPNAYRIALSNIPANPELNGKKLRVTTSLKGTKEFFVPFRVHP